MIPGLAKLPPAWRDFLRRVIPFGIIGMLSLILTVSVYGLLSRTIWPLGSHTLEYVMTTVLISWLNYEANRRFTFGLRERSVAAMGRFAGVVVVALGLNAVFFWLGHEVLHLWDFAVIVGTAFIVAGFTFFSHQQFTFHPAPWRHFKKKT